MDLSGLFGLGSQEQNWSEYNKQLKAQLKAQFERQQFGCIPPYSYESAPNRHFYMAIDPAKKPREDVMEISFDFQGGVKLIDGHFVVKAGCKTAICHTPKEVANIIQEQMEEHFKGKYKKK